MNGTNDIDMEEEEEEEEEDQSNPVYDIEDPYFVYEEDDHGLVAELEEEEEEGEIDSSDTRMEDPTDEEPARKWKKPEDSPPL